MSVTEWTVVWGNIHFQRIFLIAWLWGKNQIACNYTDLKYKVYPLHFACQASVDSEDYDKY